MRVTTMKNTSGPGADGWRVAELQALPLQLFGHLAEVLNLVEDTGTWLVPLTQGLISVIPKDEGSAPQKSRPIGLMAPVYRLWGSMRIRDVIKWQNKWADTHCMADGQGYVLRTWMDLALSVESALVNGSDLVGVSIDWSKCFDRVPARNCLQAP